MDNQFTISKTVKTSLKIYAGVFAFYILISILSLFPLIPKFSNTLIFYDSLKKLSFNLFYVFIGYNLFKLIYDLKSELIELIAKSTLKRMANIWYALVALLAVKILFEMYFRYYFIPKLNDKTIANELGYSTKMQIAPHADLLIAVFIVWVLIYVLNYALKLKQEQDLTI